MQMSDSLVALKMKFTLKGTNIQNSYKLNYIDNNKMGKLCLKTPHSSQYPNTTVATQITRSSMSKLPKKLIQISRNSFESQKMDNETKRCSQELKRTTNTMQDQSTHKQITVMSCEKSKMVSHWDLQFHIKKINPVKIKKCNCGDCEQCLKDFNYYLNIFTSDISLPQISAKSWCIWRRNKNNKFSYYFGKRIHKVREIASLTKMLTAMVAIDFLKANQYDPSKIQFKVKKSSVLMKGTTARLEMGQIYTISELLYGLMLPSGNDAAVAIADAIGLLFQMKTKNYRVNPLQPNWYQDYVGNGSKSYCFHFINLMNEKCVKIGLLDTKMYNSHGNDAFNQLKNVSTCNEVAKISVQFIEKYEELKTICTTKFYCVERYNKKWENTNRLLDDGFEGIKTGINQSSGPCLSACYKDLIIIVLNSKSMNERWIEVKKLVRWIIKKGS